MKNFVSIAVTIVLLCLAGCSGCNKTKSRPKPDVSDIKADVRLLRFDQDLFEFKNNDFLQQQEMMQQKYGPFYNFFVSQFIVGGGPTEDSAQITEEYIQRFVNDLYVQRLQDSINLHFGNTKDIEEELTQSFKYFKYYLPEIIVPRVITVNSGFSLGAFTYDKDVLGIGLDLYLGADNPDYDSAGVYEYVQHKMRREYIARNAAEVLYNFYFGSEELSRGKPLIEAIVDKGKKMYFLSYVLPDAPDSLIVGFTQRQTEWCENSEYEIWKFLNDKDMLYKSDYMDQKRYLDEAPTTTGMPPEAPGSIGNWIGLQVVRKFVKETGNKISLHDLVTKYDGKTIFEKAKYRPSKSVF